MSDRAFDLFSASTLIALILLVGSIANLIGARNAGPVYVGVLRASAEDARR